MRTAIFTILFIFAVTVAAHAIAEKSYSQTSPNGKYLFVMLSKSPAAAGSVDELKKYYDHSGLYRNTRSRKRLWRVNWYSTRVHVSSDGVHLVRIGRPIVYAINAKPNMAQLAVAFYKNGELLKKYMVGDLITDPGDFVKCQSGFRWQDKTSFDDASGIFNATLVSGKNLSFDIRNGSIIVPNKNRR